MAIVIARWLANSTGQPSVVFELLLGIVVGSIGLWIGHPLFDFFANMEVAGEILSDFWSSNETLASYLNQYSEDHSLSDSFRESLDSPLAPTWISIVHILWAFANLGVLLLLFNAGLETSVTEMKKVGGRAAAVAAVGIAAPFLLAYVACFLLHVQMDFSAHAFLAATLCATSVGISARVFEDLKKLDSAESRLVMGAAVIDDILGLILLSLVVGVVATGSISVYPMINTLLVAFAFLVAVFFAGDRIAGWGAKIFQRLDPKFSRLLFPLFLMFVLALVSESIHLAAIIGAFAAGLVLNENHFQSGTDSIHNNIAPLERFFAPLFFLLVGMQVRLDSMFDWSTLLLASVLTVAAVAGKVVTGLVAGKEMNAMVIGWGMVPRGEVGLVFLGIGRGLGVLNEVIFSALVIVVIVTTLLAPIQLKRALVSEESPVVE